MSIKAESQKRMRVQNPFIGIKIQPMLDAALHVASRDTGLSMTQIVRNYISEGLRRDGYLGFVAQQTKGETEEA